MMAVMGVLLTGCEKGQPFHKKTIDLTVTSAQWDFDQNANMFFCHFDIPELTENVYNYAEISVNHEYNSGKNNAYQVALPETIYKVEYEKDDKDSIINTVYYQQHLDYAYGVGFVEVFCTISDFYYEESWTPDAMLFRLQMSY